MYNSDIAVSDSSLVAASALVGSILATYGIILLLITIAQIVAMWKYTVRQEKLDGNHLFLFIIQ